jgi:TnpA family transposase
MPRRRVLTDAQLDALLALRTGEAELIQHYSLSGQDLAVVLKRRRPHNQLGFALQLCALRFPGRLIRPGELVPMEMARFVAEQLDIDPATLADYATRSQTRYDQIEALRELFGSRSFSQPDRRQLSAWLLPIALATVSGMAVANALMVELRRRGIAAPGVTVIERM